MRTGRLCLIAALLLTAACGGPKKDKNNDDPGETPSAPTALGATPGDQQIELSWAAPLDNGGNAITGYVVAPFEGTVALAEVALPASTTSTTISGLANGTTYELRVRATNARGDGPDASTTGRPATIPSAPSGITLRKNPIRITWDPPTEDGGASITRFRVTPFVGTTAQTPILVESSATSFGPEAPPSDVTIPFLPDDETYTFEVAAENDVGAGVAVVSSSMTLGCGIPGLPQLRMYQSASGVALGDLDGDGVTDVLTSDGGNVYSYLGRGDGTFLLVETVPVLNIKALELHDYDGDSVLDIVAGVEGGTIRIYPGAGDGTFGNDIGGPGTGGGTTSIAVGSFGAIVGTGGPVGPASPAQTLTAADLDADGNDDVIVANDEFHVRVLWGSTAGFAVTTTVPAGSQVWNAAVGDMNEDGILDIVTANYFSISDGSVSVILGTGARTFGASQEFPALAGSAHAGVADFDGDGHLDVAASTNTAFSILRGQGNGLLLPRVDYGFDSNGAYQYNRMEVYDVNSDGNPDVVIADQANRVLFFRGVGDGTFPVIPVYPAPGNSEAVIAGHFDEDAFVDLVTISGVFAPFFGNGDGTFVAGTSIPMTAALRSGVTADFDGDGDDDIAFSATVGGEASAAVLFGNAAGGFTEGPVTGTGVFDFPGQTIAADFNEDGLPDLVMQTIEGARSLLYFRNDTAGAFTPSSLAGDARGVVVADFDGDLHQDIATSIAGSPTIFFGAGNGTFTETAVLSFCSPEIAADFDGDGLLDLASGSPTFAKVCFGTSPTTFAPAVQIPLGTTLLARLSEAVDVDGDGSTDLVGMSDAGTPIVLLNDALGEFSVGDYATGQGMYSVTPAIADFNGDGKNDLAAAYVGTGMGGQLRILLQHCFE